MATLAIVSNGTTIYPELPIDRTPVLVAEDRRMVNGQLRRSYRAEKMRLSYRRGGLSEAERTTWVSAHPFSTSFTHVDELGVSRTVVTVRRDEVLEETIVASNASFYVVQVEVEEV